MPFQATDLTYEEVNDFHYYHFKSQGRYPKKSKTGAGFPKGKYNVTCDQMIRGWVQILRKDSIPTRVISDNKNTCQDDSFPPGSDDSLYLSIYVKGHALKKIIYCLWHTNVVFYCPENAFTENLNAVRYKPENFAENRFFQEAEFYYHDERKNKWIKKKFIEFQQIESFARADVAGSRDCNSQGGK